jgi:flavin reductase (DIM6/NTAB) family NADH-FMN oxidoreductase RutF
VSNYKEITHDQFEHSPFKLLDKDWMLVTAAKEGKVNTMTASWGGFGVLWGKSVAYVVIRPQRYTKEFIDHSNTFSLSFFDNSYKKQLGYLGSVSGRDTDKIQNSALTVTEAEEGTPYFAEAKIVILAKKLYAQELKPEHFTEIGLDEKFYPEHDYHTLYIAEVSKILIAE